MLRDEKIVAGQQILSAEIAIQPINPEDFTAEELRYWSNNPPEAIVLATGSVRKAYFVWLAMHDFNFAQAPDFLTNKDWLAGVNLGTNPLEFQQIIEANIRNGDGALSQGEALYLGEYYGVPVYVDPQNGETDTNHDAGDQSKRKIDSVTSQSRYSEKDVIVVACDTVGLVDPEGEKHALGKPRNHPDFKDDPILCQKGEICQTQKYRDRLKAFDIWYVLRYYTSLGKTSLFADENNKALSFTEWFEQYDESLENVLQTFDLLESPQLVLPNLLGLETIIDRHINHLVIKRGDKYHELETTLNIPLDQAYQLWLIAKVVGIEALIIYLESGGGGMTQTGIFSEHGLANDGLEKWIEDDNLLKVLESIEDKRLRYFYLLLHTMGAPLWAARLIDQYSAEQPVRKDGGVVYNG